jgi:hypothetical protein
MKVPGLSKSRITTFEQCPKRLWLQTHRPEKAVLHAGTEARFVAGHEVGAAACALHPDGLMINAEPDLSAALATTSTLLGEPSGVPLFEATFAHEGVLVRADIITPDDDGRWHVAEIKSSTSRKGYHLGDLATQVWVMRGAGVPIGSAVIRHINNQFVLEKLDNYYGLFVDVPSLEEIESLVIKRGEIVAAARDVMVGNEPQREMGEHCNSPFACEFQAYCSRFMSAPEWPISLLPNTGKKIAGAWAEQGVFELTEVPDGSFSSPLHDRIHRATMTGEIYHDVEGARRSTRQWAFPRTWLDFETIAFVVPRWIGTRPWEQVPFQFSAHVEQSDGSVEHCEFLSLDGNDPRLACAEALLTHIPDQGAVIAYNASFERSCITRLAEHFPDLATPLRAIAARVVDLLPVTRNHWYHRDQRGSWSIKAVLPTICAELDYKSLAVQHGAAAQTAYLEAINADTPASRQSEIDEALRAYCGRDTEAMMKLMQRMTLT